MYRLKNGESIDCKVISLKKDYYRRKKFFYQKNSEFFEIFDAATPELNRNLNLFDEIAFEKFYLRKPLPGEIGCTLSHYLVLREYVESESSTPFILVAEDDAIFQDNLFDVIEECADYLPSKGVAMRLIQK
ncbi:glycosyltransferase family 25 protein [Rothia aerolata]|uniref:Glycosyl transferase family 25 domain-containing protein n=1 Tax=Rothia aerolata TaxID=1812262 RepID=A0A917MTA2_9MICC|nr:glycosyltransferase family 25 protein [Rothia aerolata]GGH62907.1 hypothetical protein GCM10007359_13630 [Rothia aerolata]